MFRWISAKIIPAEKTEPDYILSKSQGFKMKWNILFSKIKINWQQFQVTSENKTQGNL